VSYGGSRRRKLLVYKVFARRSEVTIGRYYLESSLYHTFFTSTETEYNRKSAAADDGMQRMNRTLIPNVLDEGRQAEEALASNSIVEA
jgi:hypothetical protein